MGRDVPKMDSELYSAPHKAQKLLAGSSQALPSRYLPTLSSR